MPRFAHYILPALTATSVMTTPVALAHGKNDTDHVTKTYDLSGFDALELGGVYDLDVTVGGDVFSITVKGHQSELDRLEVDVKSDVLRLERDGGTKIKRNGKTQSLELRVTMPDLIALTIGGVANGQVSGVDTGNFELTVGGVADLEVSGECKSLTVEVGGVGDVDTRDLECKDVEVSLGGVGDVSVHASYSVDATVGGIGSITVYGSPEKVKKTKGFLSSVTIK